MVPPEGPFWERPEIVARFAAREPDHRLVALSRRFAGPARALDLGCAAGRNTIFLAARGFSVIALDASEAMRRATTERLRSLHLDGFAAADVRHGVMDRLTGIGDGSIDLIVALGVYHEARDLAELRRALAESHRVLARGGLLLAACHAPETRVQGVAPSPVPGAPHVYDGFPTGRSVLLRAGDFDRECARHGLLPWIPTETRSVETEDGCRVTVNALLTRF